MSLLEKEDFPCANSLRGYGFIDVIKARLEVVCPFTMYYDDIIVLSAEDSITMVIAVRGSILTICMIFLVSFLKNGLCLCICFMCRMVDHFCCGHRKMRWDTIIF